MLSVALVVVCVLLGGGLPAFAAPVTLSWTDQSNNEDGFRPYRQSNGGAFLPQGEVSVDVTTFADDLPLDDATYCYYVVAFNTKGESPPSNTACLTRHSSAPNAPTNLTVTVTVVLP